MNRHQQAILIADLGFGDAGKGTITDFLCRQHAAHTIVRYNGGPQAAHTVVTDEGKHHTFAQFGSGMLFPGTRTLLSRFMLINPFNMLKEERHLRSVFGITDALQRTQIERGALVITPFQRAANRLREEARGANRHGSCGEGIGECMADALRDGDAVLCAGDLADRATLLKKLPALRAAKYAEISELLPLLPDNELVRRELAIFSSKSSIEDCVDVYGYFSDCLEIIDEEAVRALFAQPGTMIFEGAQGVLLDENYGFAPYTTWSTTTFANAETLLQEADYAGEVSKIGVLRAYATRHGAGPFPSEDAALTGALPDQHNTWNDWQQTFRVGYLDLVAAVYAREVVGKLDGLAVTNLDRLEALPEWQVCTAYRYQGEAGDLSAYFEQAGDWLTKIRLQRPADLAHQEQLTQKLWSCRPVYQAFPHKVGERLAYDDAYFGLLEERLEAPIVIYSYGPTAGEKRTGGI